MPLRPAPFLTLILLALPAPALAQPRIGTLPPLPAAGAYAIERLPGANLDPRPAVRRALRAGEMRDRLAAQCANAPVVVVPGAAGVQMTALAGLGGGGAPAFQRRATTRCTAAGPQLVCQGGGLNGDRATLAAAEGGRHVLDFANRTSILHPCFGPDGLVTRGGQPLLDGITRAMR